MIITQTFLENLKEAGIKVYSVNNYNDCTEVEFYTPDDVLTVMAQIVEYCINYDAIPCSITMTICGKFTITEHLEYSTEENEEEW